MTHLTYKEAVGWYYFFMASWIIGSFGFLFSGAPLVVVLIYATMGFCFTYTAAGFIPEKSK